MRFRHAPRYKRRVSKEIALSVFQKLIQRWSLFWTLILYGTLLLCLAGTLSRQRLVLFELLILFFSCVLFLLVYHRLFLPQLFLWPKSLRSGLLYFCIQFTFLSILMCVDREFGLLGYSLMFHVAASFQMRFWPIPMTAANAFIAIMMGADHMLLSEQWLDLAGILLYLLIWPAVAVFIYIMIDQRFRTQDLINELNQAQAALVQHTRQAEELATLRERERLARDMHDSIGHALVLMNVKLEAAQRLYALDAQRGAHELEATRTLIRTTMRDLRQSLANLRAPAELEQGLLPALKLLVENSARQSSIDICCCLPEHIPELSVVANIALWKVAREALNNVERHAAAQHVTLSLEQQGGALILRICDDGKGICNQDMSRSGHFGLVGMHELAQQAGGFVDIRGGGQGGTCVTYTMNVGCHDTTSNTRSDR